MEVKTVIKSVFYLVTILCFTANIMAQSIASKNLLFDNSKDSIIVIDTIKYYKIDKNLFDINRFNQIDTIYKNRMSEIKYVSINELWKEGKKLFHKVSEDENLFIETYNEIFEKIYVIEKLPNCKYKRTRVWWIDY
ncbi:MAG: hypothetical protein V3V28_01335 [Polaribacter sp.]|uniref:hypothetical protein n=1 Tax=Polaribacter sp. TaxID=1920175 RepID=UPI002F353743